MPELTRPDGARIHYEVQGEGEPTVLLASYWSWVPGIYADVLSDLESDHRVVTYHLRGTGDSSRQGPYDMESDTGDLEAVAETAGGPALLVATADGANRAARLGARRPDLVSAVVTFGTAPFARAAFEGEEGLATSDTVIDAFLEMLESNYRGGMRTFLEATNPQASEDEMRERLAALVEFNPSEAALTRLRAWLDDDPREEARALGNRLWVFSASDVAGPWLPPAEQLTRLRGQLMPEANVVALEPGPVSDPEGAAVAIRRIAAARAGDERK
jgi:pimeloyl-ACP methyl ester carboxylesterase